jgi:transposase, IS30 family
MKDNKKYGHITKTERREIALLTEKKYSFRGIARMLERSPNTISKEINKNSVGGVYDPLKADHKSYVKRKYSKYQGMKVVGDIQLRTYVEEKIKEDWSPEEVAGRLQEIDGHIKYASRGAIYKFVYSVYGRLLEQHLRYNGKKKRSGKRQKVSQLKNRVFIDKRPKIIGKKQRYGDWEGDFIVSGKSGKGMLIVLYERKAMHVIIKKITFRSCAVVNRYIQEMTGGFVCFNSLTIDNDISFRKHEELSELLGAPVYFCHPYHSWEKGGVENINKLIRQYILKGSDISKYSDEYLKETETKLNNRPRKSLNYKTPLEVMLKNKQFKTLENFGIINKQKTPIAGVLLEG